MNKPSGTGAAALGLRPSKPGCAGRVGYAHPPPPPWEAPKNTKARKRPAGRAGLFPGLSRPVDWGESHISSYKGVWENLRNGDIGLIGNPPFLPSMDIAYHRNVTKPGMVYDPWVTKS